MNTTKNVHVYNHHAFYCDQVSEKRVVKYTVSVKFKCVEMTVLSRSQTPVPQLISNFLSLHSYF